MKEKLLSVVLIISLISCSKDVGVDPSRRPDLSYNPQLSPENFLQNGQWLNPFVTGKVGKTYVYEGITDEGYERIEITRLPGTKNINGIECGILRESAWMNDKLEEVCEEYLAEDHTGNVWILGIDVNNYNLSGDLINHSGSWISGVDNAKPGIAVPAEPVTGLRYRQEYYFNIAENEAEIIEAGIAVTTPMGSYNNCISIKEWSALEPGVEELKFYAPSVGLIKESNLTSQTEIVLIDIK